MRLLFAEDQPQLRRSVTKALTAAGYSVDAAADGAQALDDLDGVDYDAIDDAPGGRPDGAADPARPGR